MNVLEKIDKGEDEYGVIWKYLGVGYPFIDRAYKVDQEMSAELLRLARVGAETEKTITEYGPIYIVPTGYIRKLHQAIIDINTICGTSLIDYDHYQKYPECGEKMQQIREIIRGLQDESPGDTGNSKE